MVESLVVKYEVGVEYIPAAQAVQLVAPTIETVPEVQVEQLVIPVEAAYVPAEHAVHVAALMEE